MKEGKELARLLMMSQVKMQLADDHDMEMVDVTFQIPRVIKEFLIDFYGSEEELGSSLSIGHGFFIKKLMGDVEQFLLKSDREETEKLMAEILEEVIEIHGEDAVKSTMAGKVLFPFKEMAKMREKPDINNELFVKFGIKTQEE